MAIDTTALMRSMPCPSDLELEWARNDQHELDAFFTYSDRSTYLAWVADWKAEYTGVSERIRTLKRDRRELQRAGAYGRAAARPLGCDRQLARGLLAIRRAAKRDSWARRTAAQVA